MKHKLHTIINTLGLAVGIASCLIISSFINDEFTFDTFHSNSEKIYRVYLEERYEGGEEFSNSVTPLILAETLKSSFPEVDATTQYHQTATLVKKDGETLEESLDIVSPGFFDLFDFEVLAGSTQGIFQNQSDLVLTEAYAEKYYQDYDPIGKTLEMRIGDTYYPMTVKAVVANPPSNSSIQFDLLISDLNNKRLYRAGMLKSWYNVFTETYLLTSEDPQRLTAKLPTMVRQVLGEDYEEGSYVFHLQSLTDIHLNTEIPVGNVPVSDPKYAYILGFIAFFIILLASINFITLSIGKSIYRAKEVGIRKVAGAIKSQLATQFLTESLLIAFVSGIAGLILTSIALPVFNELAQRQLQFEFSTFLGLSFTILIFVVGIGAGIYPAVVLSSFKPILILKGKLGVGAGRQNFRKGMVVAQFVISIFLLTTTLLMTYQIDYLQNKNLGFNSESVLTVDIDAPFKGSFFTTLEDAWKNAELFQQSISSDPNVLSTAIAAQKFGNGAWISLGFKDKLDNYHSFNYNIIDSEYAGTMQMKFVQGRDFDPKISSDQNSALIVNEAMMKYFNWDNPLSERLPGDFDEHMIIGVVKDFNYESLHGKVEPLAMSINPKFVLRGVSDVSFFSTPAPVLHIKVANSNISQAISSMEKSWEELFATRPFAFDFVDERLKTQYTQEQNLKQIVTYASGLSILIATMGLFGLVTLATNGRVKEIGIRKVLGASEKTILYLLGKEYVVMIVVALLLSIPLSIYFINDWLNSFEYRTALPLEIFLLAGGIIAGISFLTISYNVIKASKAAPAETLRSE